MKDFLLIQNRTFVLFCVSGIIILGYEYYCKWGDYEKESV